MINKLQFYSLIPNKLFNLISGEIKYFENFDLQSIVTPVNADRLEQLLIETKYPKNKTKKLIDGFRNGFDLGYRGPTKIQ